MNAEDIKTIAIGADHAGYLYKEKIHAFLSSEGFEVLDYGTDNDKSVDYPDFIHPVSEAIEEGKAQAGVIICGSGNGVAMTANKHQGIRAALSWNSEIAKLGREHNNANVLAIPSRFVESDEALQMVEIFFHTDFEGGRHERRVNKIACS